MTFVLKMVGRELRASWRRLLFFFVCVAIGVGRHRRRCDRSSRAFGPAWCGNQRTLAADVLIQSRRGWTPELRADLDAGSPPPRSTREANRSRPPTMVRADGGQAVARMVELKGVQAGYPLYGTLALKGGQTYSHALIERWRRPGAAGTSRATRRCRGGSNPDWWTSVYDPRCHRSGTGPSRRRVHARFACAGGSRRIFSRQDCCRSAAGPPISCCSRCGEDGSIVSPETSQRQLQRPVCFGALVSVDRGSDWREPPARREFSFPGRIHHRRARRYRRVERHARVRPTEDSQRRHSEMRGCVDPAGACHLRDAGGVAGHGGERDRCRTRGSRQFGRFRQRWPNRSAACRTGSPRQRFFKGWRLDYWSRFFSLWSLYSMFAGSSRCC